MNLEGGPLGGDYEYIHDAAHIFIEPISDTHALITVTWTKGPNRPALIMSTYALMGSTTIRQLTKDCTEQVKEFDWQTFFQTVLQQVIRHQRDGGDPIQLSTLEPVSPKFLLNPVVADPGPTSLIAPGGSGKSYLAAAISLAIASGTSAFFANYAPKRTGPVLYLDWEADADTHRYRMERLCRGIDQPIPTDIWYYNQSRPLADSARAWERRAAQLGITLLVIDSVMPARGDRSGGALGGAADIGAMYDAIRRIGVPALLVDHTAKGDRTAKRGAFGSVANENRSRLQWTMNPKWDGDTLWATLSLHKTNNTSKTLPPVSIAIRHDNERNTSTITREDRASVSAISSVKEQVKDYLEGAGMGTAAEIASTLGLDRGQVSARLSDLKKSGQAVEYDGVWGAFGA